MTNEAFSRVLIDKALEFSAWNLLLAKLTQHNRGVRQANISNKDILGLDVPIPPLPMQKEFARRVTEIRELILPQAASHRRLEDLFQSLLHRTFNGEL